MFSVVHFRMELYGIEASCPVFHSCYRAVIRMSRDHKALRRTADVVRVAHPARVDIVGGCQYPAFVIYRDLCAAVLTCRSRVDVPSEEVCHELRSVAYAQHRNAEREYAVVYRRRALSVCALRSSGEYDPVRTELPDGCRIHFIKIMYLRVDSALPYAACDKLIVLSAEVYNKYPAVCHLFTPA